MSGAITAIAVGSAYTAYQGKKSADKAIAASKEGTEASIAETQRQFDLTRSDTAYQRKAGEAATGALLDVLNLNPFVPEQRKGGPFNRMGQGVTSAAVMTSGGPRVTSAQPFRLSGQTPQAPIYQSPQAPTESFDYQADPGFAFRQQQAEKALQRIASQRGYGESRTGQALVGLSQNMASQEYQAAYDRWLQQQQIADMRKQQDVENLFRLAGYGGQAVQASANAGANAANNTTRALLTNASNIGSAAQYGGESINNAVQGGIQNFLTFKTYNDLLKGGGGVSSGGVRNIMANQYPDVAYT